MNRHVCHTCDVLKEIYWLKAGQFVLAVRSTRTMAGWRTNEDEVQALKNAAMDALRTLMRHVNSCYGFTLDKVA